LTLPYPLSPLSLCADESSAIKSQLESALEHNTTREREMQEMAKELQEATAKALVQEGRIETLLSDLSAVKSMTDDEEAAELKAKETKAREEKEKSDAERKQREEQDKESRNFYAVRLMKIQTDSADEIERITNEKSTIERQLESTKIEYEKEIKELQDAFSASHDDVEMLRGEVKQVKGKIVELQCELVEEKKTSEELAKAVDIISNRLQIITEETNTVNEGRNMLQSMKNVLQDENDTLRATLEKLECEFSVLQASSDTLLQDRAALESKVERLEDTEDQVLIKSFINHLLIPSMMTLLYADFNAVCYYSPRHRDTLHCSALQCTTLHWTALHCRTLH
jgi:chromosome segregation ATPase